MITTKNGIIKPPGNIHSLSKPIKPVLGRWVIHREPMRKSIARNGVKQSMLKYSGVR